jgi:hypothetical protein
MEYTTAGCWREIPLPIKFVYPLDAFYSGRYLYVVFRTSLQSDMYMERTMDGITWQDVSPKGISNPDDQPLEFIVDTGKDSSGSLVMFQNPPHLYYYMDGESLEWTYNITFGTPYGFGGYPAVLGGRQLWSATEDQGVLKVVGLTLGGDSKYSIFFEENIQTITAQGDILSVVSAQVNESLLLSQLFPIDDAAAHTCLGQVHNCWRLFCNR